MEICSALLLAPDARGGSALESDGYLTLNEIYRLDLHGCRLAILSACDTNFGPHQAGEGTWALSRGFLVAGARHVVASNWFVDDKAGASLISYFSGGVAQQPAQSGVSEYASALHAAQQWVRSQEQWKSPFYWGGFVMISQR